MTAPPVTGMDAPVVDFDLAALFEKHARWERPCLICGKPGGPECLTCLLNHDDLMRRAEDI